VSGDPAAVFVVEDDADVRESVVETLNDGGWEVVTAENGAVALSKLATLPRPCLIVLDLVMPEMNGFEFLGRLKALPDVWVYPVLIISANAHLEKAELYPGVLGTLMKPFTSGGLLAWVEQYCPR
jgi:CheY-like chemotaxis protein